MCLSQKGLDVSQRADCEVNAGYFGVTQRLKVTGSGTSCAWTAEQHVCVFTMTGTPAIFFFCSTFGLRFIKRANHLPPSDLVLHLFLSHTNELNILFHPTHKSLPACFNLSILDTDIFTESLPSPPSSFPQPLILIHLSAYTAVSYTDDFIHVDMLFSTRSKTCSRFFASFPRSHLSLASDGENPPSPLMNGLNTTLSPIHRFSQMQ